MLGGANIRWLTAFIDRPAGTFEPAVRFWTAVTATSVSERRGNRGQFATLIPTGGDPYLRVQQVDAGGGCHLDLHVDDLDTFARHAAALGAHVEPAIRGPAVVTSPAGMVACVVGYHGEHLRPPPIRSPGGVLNLADQLCIDVPAAGFDRECEFWSALTGWPYRDSSAHHEFAYLERSSWCPLRLLLQRTGDRFGPARAHIDIASTAVGQLVSEHQAHGATVTAIYDHWTAMKDPSGMPYCVTSRDPITGQLP